MQSGAEVHKWEKYLMNANEYGTKTQIKCYSPETPWKHLGKLPQSDAIQRWSTARLHVTQVKNPSLCWSETYLDKQFVKFEVKMKDDNREGWLSGMVELFHSVIISWILQLLTCLITALALHLTSSSSDSSILLSCHRLYNIELPCRSPN